MVAHMVHTSIPLQGENPARYKEGTVEELWTEFQSMRTVRINEMMGCRVLLRLHVIWWKLYVKV